MPGSCSSRLSPVTTANQDQSNLHRLQPASNPIGHPVWSLEREKHHGQEHHYQVKLFLFSEESQILETGRFTPTDRHL